MLYEIYNKKTKEVKYTNKTAEETEEILKNNKELEKRLLKREGYTDLIDIKTKTKVLKALNKILSDKNEPVLFEDIDKERDLCVMDIPGFFMVIAKTEQAKILLCNFIDRNEYKEDPKRFHTVPPLTLDILNNDKKIALSKYTTEYLKLVVDLFASLTEAVTLGFKYQYPLVVESNDFKVILAPRNDL